MTKKITGLIIIFLLSGFVFAEPQKEFKITVIKKSVKEVLQEAKKSKIEEETKKWKEEISLLEPRNAEDVGTLLGCVENNKNYRFACRFALEKMKYEQREFAPLFMEKLKSNNPEVKVAAIKGLSRFKYKEAVPELIKIVEGGIFQKIKTLLDAKNANVIWQSTLSLGEIGDERAIPVLLKRLKERTEDNDPFDAVTAALQTMGKEPGIGKKLLLAVMEEIRKTDDKELIGKYSSVVGAINDKEAVPILLDIVRDEKNCIEIRESAVRSLGSIREEKGLRELENLFNSNIPTVLRGGILYAFIYSKNRNALPIAVQALEDKDPRIRSTAIDLVLEIGDESVVPILKRLLNDTNREVRILAARALKKITGKDYKPGGDK